MNQIRPRARNLVVNAPRARQLARTPGRRRLEREQRDDVARVRVEDLLVCRVGRAADGAPRGDLVAPEVFDVGKHDVGGLAVELVILAAALCGNMRRDASVNDGVLLARVVVDAQAPDHEEAVARVQLPGQAPQLGVESRQGKGLRREVA